MPRNVCVHDNTVYQVRSHICHHCVKRMWNNLNLTQNYKGRLWLTLCLTLRITKTYDIRKIWMVLCKHNDWWLWTVLNCIYVIFRYNSIAFTCEYLSLLYCFSATIALILTNLWRISQHWWDWVGVISIFKLKCIQDFKQPTPINSYTYPKIWHCNSILNSKWVTAVLCNLLGKDCG